MSYEFVSAGSERRPMMAVPLGAVGPGSVGERLAQFVDELGRRDPPVRIVRKSDVWHQKAIGGALRVLTLGGQSKYMTEYVTTLGHTIYVPDDFESLPALSRLKTLRHESVHVAQFERLGWPLMTLLYVLVPLPIGLAYYRAQLELAGYAESLRTIAEFNGIAAARAAKPRIVAHFTGPDYAWMWPFPSTVDRWLEDVLAAIEAEQRARGGAA